MIPLYVGALALGGVLIAASIALGGGKEVDSDADGHVDGDADAGADVHVDGEVQAHAHPSADSGAGPWLPFLSMRFWTFALACFGLTGVLLSLAGFSQLIVAPTASLLGLALGWIIAAIFRSIQRTTVTGTIHLGQLAGAEAQVLIGIGPGKLGKVRVLVDGQDVDLLARTSDPHALLPGQTALIVEVDDGVAVVTPLARLPLKSS